MNCLPTFVWIYLYKDHSDYRELHSHACKYHVIHSVLSRASYSAWSAFELVWALRGRTIAVRRLPRWSTTINLLLSRSRRKSMPYELRWTTWQLPVKIIPTTWIISTIIHRRCHLGRWALQVWLYYPSSHHMLMSDIGKETTGPFDVSDIWTCASYFIQNAPHVLHITIPHFSSESSDGASQWII